MAACDATNGTLAAVLRDLRILSAVARGLEPFTSEDIVGGTAPDRRRARPNNDPRHCGAQWGHLKLRGLLASGSFGAVYRAYDPRMRRQVALKLPRIGRPNRHRNARLLEEARRLARINHPGVVRIHGAAVRGGRAGLWMELVRGQTLDACLREHGPLPAREAARIGRDLAATLHAVHNEGVVHGDIKPQNVIREHTGRVVLIDFGCSRAMVRLGAPRRIAGTPLYLAPEVMAGGAATAASDIYSLGVLLFHLASGEYPVPAANLAELSDAHRDGMVQRLQELRPDLPSAFCDTVHRAVSLEPSARHQSASELERDLAQF
jgi:eukaryotic-like serine/threonine-protein kinase